MAQAQVQYREQVAHAVTAAAHPQQQPSGYPVAAAAGGASLYPSLDEYMGLSLTPECIAANMPVVVSHPPGQALAVRQQGGSAPNWVAPVTGQGNKGVARAQIQQGVREATLCKDGSGKIGLRVQAISKGIFVQFVHKNTPASMGGLRFGDQILQINGENVAGWSKDKCMKVLKKASSDKIVFAIRDRPFERNITLQKDSTNHVGFVFKNGKITQIAKDTSAARNGLLIDHALLEVNGQNVIGLKDKETSKILGEAPQSITLTIMPNFVFDHMMKSMSSGLVKSSMDHSVPEI